MAHTGSRPRRRFIHRTAWNRNSRKLICSVVHRSSHQTASAALILVFGYRTRTTCDGTEWIFASMNTSVGLRTRVSPPSKSHTWEATTFCRNLFPAGRILANAHLPQSTTSPQLGKDNGSLSLQS